MLQRSYWRPKPTSVASNHIYWTIMTDLLHWEEDPNLYLFTSLTAGSSHIVTATSRIETILRANRVPFKGVDTATDDSARKLYGRRGKGRKLPLLVKEGFVIAVRLLAYPVGLLSGPDSAQPNNARHDSTYLANPAANSRNCHRISSKSKNGTSTASSRRPLDLYQKKAPRRQPRPQPPYHLSLHRKLLQAQTVRQVSRYVRPATRLPL